MKLLQLVESVESLKPFKPGDASEWQGANDFPDGKKPMIARVDMDSTKKGITVVVSGTDSSGDVDDVLVGVHTSGNSYVKLFKPTDQKKAISIAKNISNILDGMSEKEIEKQMKKEKFSKS